MTALSAYEAAVRLAGCLDEDGLDYAIGGALALAALGVVRATKDVDISMFAADGPRIFDALERAGAIVDRADATRALARIGMFTARMGKVLVDVFAGDHPHAAATRARRVRLADSTGRELWYCSAEDLVITKLFFGRDKDVIDLGQLYARLHDRLDRPYVRDWIVQMVPAADRRLAILDDLERRFPT